MAQTTNQFQADEYVLAYHGPLLYEARVLLAENWTNANTLLGSTGPHYFIHYKGWKQTWDEWVPEQRLLKLNEQSYTLRRRLLEAQSKKGRGVAAASPATGAGATERTGKGKDKASASTPSGRGVKKEKGEEAFVSEKVTRSSRGNGNGNGAGNVNANANANASTPSGGKKGESSASASAAAAAAHAAALAAAATNSGTGAGAGGGTGSSASATAGGGTPGTGRKRARDTALDAELETARRPEVKIIIPDVLKLQLVDDWENVTKHNQLVTLPRTPNVRELLEEYRQYAVEDKKNRSARSTGLLTEIISGITLYFDKALGNNLLYRFERAQYVEQTRRNDGDSATGATGAAAGGETGNAAAGAAPLLGAGKKRAMSEIYGAEHLLRLFVNFGPFISYTNIDSESLNILRECINDIMKWMIKEQRRLFIKEYETTTMQYQNLSRT